MEKTLIIIKPDAVKKGIVGKILARFEEEQIKIKKMKMLHLTRQEAEGFYAVHRGKSFFDSLTSFMSEGPIVVAVLEADNVISRVRKIMGATNPEDADKGTIRKDFASSTERNCIHGSDSQESAKFEISYFFSGIELK